MIPNITVEPKELLMCLAVYKIIYDFKNMVTSMSSDGIVSPDEQRFNVELNQLIRSY